MAKALSAISGNGLRARFIRSSGWSTLNFGASQFLRLLSNLILTRLLFPEAFGLMALVTVFLIGLSMFSDTGITAAIQQNERGDDPEFLDTARTIQIIRGFLLWFLTWPLGWFAASFYDVPLLAWLLPIMGVTLIIDGFRPSRSFTAARHLMIGRLTIAQLTATSLGMIVTCTLAWWLGSIWALVFGAIISSALNLGLVYLLLDGRKDRLRLDPECLRSLFSFGKWIFLSTVCGFLTNQGDRLILGKFLTLEVLGIYNIAFFLASVPTLLGFTIGQTVMLPYLREKSPWESRANLLAFRRVRLILTGGLIVATVALALAGPLLVELLYDARYAAAGSILVLIALISVPSLLSNAYPTVYLARGDSRSYTILLAIQSFLNTGGLLVGALYGGLVGALLSLGVARLISYPIVAYAAHRYKIWDPKLDLCLAGIALLGVAGALYFHYDDVLKLTGL